ncbi:MAG: 50S ribosomal protein L13 [Patescibacteria group bacterium]
MKEIIIDATDIALGRIASQVAVVLMGKNKADYQPNKITGDKVKVINIDKLKLTGKKEADKVYYRYSGYPGGIKTKKVIDMPRKELLKKALYNMLPKNKLRKEYLKRLTIQ